MLIGENVYLRSLQITDLEKSLEWRNDLFIKESTMSHPFPITYEQEKEWYDNILRSKDNSTIYFAICGKSLNELIGYIFLSKIDWIHRNCFWGGAIGDKVNIGKGFGKEAVFLIINYAFKSLNMNKIYAYVLAEHPALKTWLKTGAIIEGTLKQHCWQKGKYQDVQLLAWYRID